MQYNGGNSENIYGEILNFEIIEHEKHQTIECRLERRIVHTEKWFFVIIMFMYFLAFVEVHRKVEKKSVGRH